MLSGKHSFQKENTARAAPQQPPESASWAPAHELLLQNSAVPQGLHLSQQPALHLSLTHFSSITRAKGHLQHSLSLQEAAAAAQSSVEP